jgi:hypothetical protein
LLRNLGIEIGGVQIESSQVQEAQEGQKEEEDGKITQKGLNCYR